MKKIPMVILVMGSLAALALGGLWLPQGLAIIQLCPILCFADCACVTGGSATWAIIGGLVSLGGVLGLLLTSQLISPGAPRSR